jgi:ribosomal protein S27AE
MVTKMATPNDPIRCGKCQSELEKDFEFCSECGESVFVTQCAQCQKQIKTGSKFCPYCGAGKPEPEPEPEPTIIPNKPVDREPVPTASLKGWGNAVESSKQDGAYFNGKPFWDKDHLVYLFFP